ncbi:MAG: ATP-binding protein [Oscillatoriales cyanobacterium C42_A2020_001]|nr:ATP-binding protein [Leptolyngbyaceae cyanobacterium C42_A2020_001]
MDEPFPDNWTYLRTELNWLDRVLANTVARQRKETKEVDRVARSPIDRATSHWWKGLLNLEGTVASDSPVDMPKRGAAKGNYQQQMEARIRASQQQGIVLGLPSLCQTLELSTFEKNLVLIALAPEISRRYERIYRFLQEPEQAGAFGLPSVDLVLRLLCRNDAEWRSARLSLAASAKLLRHRVVQLPEIRTEPFLAHPVKLSDAIVEYLLAEQPQLDALDHLLQTASCSELNKPRPLADAVETWMPESLAESTNSSLNAAIAAPVASAQWAHLILPDQLLASLQHLCDRVYFAEQVDEVWGFSKASRGGYATPGTVSLLIGARGTGKTTAARAIAQTLNVPLVSLDLAFLESAQSQAMLQQFLVEVPTVLLLKSAQHWFGRAATVKPTLLQRFLQARQQSRSITLLSMESIGTMKAAWRLYLTDTLEFPLPNKASRLKLWRQVFPPEIPLSSDINWQALSQLNLTGGEIVAIAREAAIYYTSNPTEHKLSMKHITQACQNRSTPLKIAFGNQKMQSVTKPRIKRNVNSDKY